MTTLANRTFYGSTKDRDEQWYLVDAADQSLGRLATNIVRLLRGKHRPQYTPHINTGAHVVVVNAAKVHVSGKKVDDKVYRRYTGYPGGLRERTFTEALERDGTFPLMHALEGMLQHNTLGREQLTCVRVYAGSEHHQQAQQPIPITFGRLGEIVVGNTTH